MTTVNKITDKEIPTITETTTSEESTMGMNVERLKTEFQALSKIIHKCQQNLQWKLT